MKKEVRTIVFDELQIEAYHFEGIVQPFPSHFHKHYVIGCIENGERHLSCKNKEYVINKGSIVIFNPGDNHSCVQNNGGTFDYRGLNISEEIMLCLAEEVTGVRKLPMFSCSVISDEEISCCFRRLHKMIMSGTDELGKEENLLLLILLLIKKCGQPSDNFASWCIEEVEDACMFMEKHYAQHLSLEQICRNAGLSKSTLIRAFTKVKGITPYCYLENIRISEAKKLLAEGVSPLDAAMRTGFSDQSHFTNYFSRFIGLTPGVYRDIFLSRKGEDKNGLEK